tara:strand:+ start:261 stop:503 length:243 start_codon:yes stop_codon:yes gene_type:complete
MPKKVIIYRVLVREINGHIQNTIKKIVIAITVVLEPIKDSQNKIRNESVQIIHKGILDRNFINNKGRSEIITNPGELLYP